MADLTVFFAVRPAGEAHGHFDAPAEHAEALRAALRGALRARVEVDDAALRSGAERAGVPAEAVERALATLSLSARIVLLDEARGAGRL